MLRRIPLGIKSGIITALIKMDDFVFFYGKDSPFSQHHPSIFEVDGTTYSHAEQYMMHQKALFFGDDEMARAIMRETNPVAMKKLGRKVRNFDADAWRRVAYAVVKKASVAKYSQNPHLLKALLDTWPKILAEASPRDLLWGIGYGRANPKAWNQATWRGKNLLGTILMDVRESLKTHCEKILADEGREMRPLAGRGPSPRRASPKRRCTGLTLKGTQCKLNALPGSTKCARHQ